MADYIVKLNDGAIETVKNCAVFKNDDMRDLLILVDEKDPKRLIAMFQDWFWIAVF